MAGDQADYAETGRCHTQARRWPLMIGNQGARILNIVGAPWPLPQLVALAALFAVCWQLRPLLADAVGGPASLLVSVVIPAVGSLPMRRTRIAGRVPWRWLLGQVSLLSSPLAGRPTGARPTFTRPYRVGGGFWLLPAGAAVVAASVGASASIPAPTTVPRATVTPRSAPADTPLGGDGPPVTVRPRRPARAAAPGPLAAPPLSTVETMRALLSV